MQAVPRIIWQKWAVRKQKRIKRKNRQDTKEDVADAYVLFFVLFSLWEIPEQNGKLHKSGVRAEKSRKETVENMSEDYRGEEFKIIDNYLMIRLPSEIDHHKSVDISAKADRYILSRQIGNVVFDFEQTTFMDSSGIGIIVGRYKKIACFGGKVFAINADNRIRRILLLSGLQNIVEIME